MPKATLICATRLTRANLLTFNTILNFVITVTNIGMVNF